MTNKEAILVLKRIEDASDEWAGLNKYAKDAFDMAIKALEGKDTNVPSNDTIPLDWIQRYADDWEDMSYAYDNPILGMLEDWRREQDE